MSDLQVYYDPDFNFDSADLVLHTPDRVYYRMHKFTLRNSSGLFQTMLSLPQCTLEPNKSDRKPYFLAIDEHSEVLGILLRMISGLETPKWTSFDQMESVLVAAEKYDMPGALTTIRHAITAPIFLDEPLKLYALTSRLEWEEEAKLASKHSLALSIYDERFIPILARTPSPYLARLFLFHRKRRNLFKIFLDTCPHFTRFNTNLRRCRLCDTKLSNEPWNTVKNLLVMEIDQQPNGESICDVDFQLRPEVQACYNVRCKCGGVLFDTASIMPHVKAGLNELPFTI